MNNNDITIIELDRPRELRFGFKALKMAKALLKKSVIDIISDLENTKRLDEETVEKLMYCALIHEDETLKLEDVENILDKGVYSEILEKLLISISKSYGFYNNENVQQEDEKENKKK